MKMTTKLFEGKALMAKFRSGHQMVLPAVAAMTTTLILSACGVLVGNPEDDEGDGDSSGTVAMGLVASATVRFYTVNEDGSQGDLIGTTTTDGAGAYRFRLSLQGAAVQVVATGGTYEDEATGDSVTLGSDDGLEAMTLAMGVAQQIHLNPLTKIAAANARRNAGAGLTQAIASANQNVAGLFGLAGTDIIATTPADLTDAQVTVDPQSNETKVGLVLAGLSQLGLDNGLAATQGIDLATALAEDYADGGFDGLNDDESLSVSSSIEPAQAMEGLNQAMVNFCNSQRNRSSLRGDHLPVTAPAPPKKPTSKPQQGQMGGGN